MEDLPGKSNYFIGNDPTMWRTSVPHYAKVKYEAVYPGIDLVFYGNQRQLEYDFILAPGVDPKKIRLAFQGAEKIAIDETQGDVILYVSGGEIRLRRPHIYQDIDGQRKEIPGSYVFLEPETRNSELETQAVGFRLAAYDATQPLVIDPVPSYSTYLGGVGIDQAFAIAVDSTGNAYVTGNTQSADFPLANPLQSIIGGGFGGTSNDAFVAKLNAAGTALIYATFIGGGGADSGRGIAVDASGNAYVTGATDSTDFP